MQTRRALRAPITTPATATVFTTVLTHGPVSRLEVARMTGLSSAAVTKAARPFIEAGYMVELTDQPRPTQGAGRPAVPLSVNPDREFFLGVKICAEELIGVVVDLQCQVRFALHRQLASTAVGEVVESLATLVADLRAQAPEYAGRGHCLGVAISGDIDRASGTVRYSPFLGWRDVPLAALLTDATGLEVTIENDVKSLAVAEQFFGDGAGVANFALVTLGTGIGCALVINHVLVAGAHGVAGEIGHVRVTGDGPPCHCGSSGCVEAIASTKAIVTAARAACGDPALSIDGAVAMARSGDTAMRQIFQRAGQAIGLGLAALANFTGPEKILVSGEGVGAYDLFETSIRTAFRQQAFGAAACPLVLNPLPFEEWARGASAVAVQSLITLRDEEILR
ncbi:ROK family protein [Streptomyces sp. NPDC051976]|uniref:ROK family protein n=1 Tax=Streptomyces sp. NPDC051976 TaxID=3154947 RepID=UPI003429D396